MPPQTAPEPAGPAEPRSGDAAARVLADAHRDAVRAGDPFLERRELDALDAAITRGRARLRARSTADRSIGVAAEWLLDNEYLLRRVLGQLRREVPAGFQRHLPRLAADGRVRVLAVAEAILDGARELDVDQLDRFLDAYQDVTPLTIAELWALPALLRLVILRRFCAVVERAAADGRAAPGPTDDPGSAAGRAIRALRLLAELDWKDVFSRHSASDKVLGADPAGAYGAMDFETRDAYRKAVEQIARSAGVDEIDVARAALARAAGGPPDGLCDHVGYWLVDAGRPAFERSLGARPEGLERRLVLHPHATLFGLLALAQLALLTPIVAYLVWLDAPVASAALAVALVWIPASVPAAMIAHWAVARLTRPRALPKLEFSRAIPQRWRTLVAVPTLLGGDDEIDRLVAQLEVHYLANPDPELRFALLTDHPDSREPPDDHHAARLARAVAGIRRINGRHGRDGRGPFYLLHREPRWNPAEGKWMGWERKRGKLEELNRYLRGDTTTTYALAIGDADGLAGIAFVLTLDSDTELPPGSAARLAGALAHPLNRPRADAAGRVRSGYTILQPRVEISPRSARRSPFSRLFSGDTGFDIYSRAVSEVYQDLFGAGIYVGKGIYDVDGFRASLDDRVPENALVSHDLFEGICGRAALASDIVVYEDYPPHYLAYLQRMHRWIRGDWQLVPWLLPSVPRAKGCRSRNDLGVLGRFQIVDNLRRSLVAPAVVALLLCGWLVLPGHPLVWTAVALLAPGAAAVLAMVQRASLPRREIGRWFLAVCFAPQEAFAVLDAIARVAVRALWTRKRMLEWTTAADAARAAVGDGVARYARRLWAGPAAAVVVGGGLAALAPDAVPWAAPWLILWLASPVLAWRISRPTPRCPEQLDDASTRVLRRVARRTWLFYETFVGPRDHWLPPDHYQEHPRGVIAHRTSPTNIAMLLLSELAAYDLGYLGPVGLSSWVANTLDGVDGLERHRGHIYNWYDTRTLEPLVPRYVSTVDSGNLAGALVALAVGCEQAADAPALRPATRAGLRDSAELLAEAAARWTAASPAPGPRAVVARTRTLVELLAASSESDAALFADCATAVDAIEADLLAALHDAEVSHDPALLRELRVWNDRIGHQLAEARREPDPEVAARLRDLAARARRLAEGMDFRFLYDDKRRLFHVGYNATLDRLDPHHYDLLASEARLASFLAIVWRQVPLQHWFALGRPLGPVGRRGRVLLSWGGSMFEYLMPRLLMRSDEDTLLHQSCAAAVDRQIAYGRERDAPWGISESGYAFLDGQEQYQYRAFGVPGLGLRRGLEEDVVVAPYASMLALPFRPRAVVRNLAHLEALGMLGRFGFFEAADFHPARAPGGRPAIVHSYMAHHHGMSLVAIANSLTRDVMVERFHAEPHVQSGALLVDERAATEAPAERVAIEPTASHDVALTPPAVLPGWEPDRRAMQIWALGNDRLTTIVTADGGGGLVWRGMAMTRWEADPVADRHGAWVYLRDLDTGATIGATPAPVGGWPADAHVRFEAGAAEFQRRHGELAIRLRIAVASGDDVEVRELEISNAGDRTRRIRVVGCVEPILEAERAAARHPAFSKLFLRASSVPELAGVVMSRLPREDRTAPVLLFRIVGDRASAPRLVGVDREAFLGRRGSFRAPAALTAEPGDGDRDATLDPLCACAADLELPPGSSRVVALVTAVAPTRGEVLDLGRRFGSPLAIRWALEDAVRAAAHRADRLGMPPALYPAAQRLVSALLAPDAALRAPPPVLAAGRPSQPRLWGRGISGDEPIVVVRMDTTAPSDLLGEVLAVHRHLRALGIRVDVVVLDEASSGYGDERSQAVRRLLAAHRATALLHQRGGIHVVAADQAGADELADLAAAARVHLDARDGSLARQLDDRPAATVELPPFAPAGPPPGSPPDPHLSLDTPALSFDNGTGGFDGDDYVIRPGAVPPAPWCNVIANDRFGCLVSEASLGASWAQNAGENRLTPWHNDPVADPPSEVLYLRDEETARVWSTTPLPAGVPTLVRHGQGATTYRTVFAGLDQTMTVFVPPELPLKIVRLSIRNASSRPRRLTATYYAEWVLGPRAADTRAYIRPDVAVAEACLLAETSWSIDFAGAVAFLASDRSLHGWTTDRQEMIGRGGDLAAPAALRRWGLSGRVVPGADPCAALQVHVDLGPGEVAEVAFFLGQADDRAAALELVRGLRAPGAVDASWRATVAHWDRVLDAVRIRTPDAALDRLTNRWLLYQTLASRVFGRTGYYQPGGAFGFRDQLQDCLALVHAEPALTRQHLLDAAARQFVEGDVLHWWHPPGGGGVRTRCSDDLLWLGYATADYVAATGDLAILREAIPFLTGDPLRPGEEAHYARFPHGETGSLLEHCRRGLERGFTAGAHGLPLLGDGDWNDGMNRVGARGRGESVWLGWFVHACVDRHADLLDELGDPEEARRWRDRLPALARALDDHGWDGDWYRRAFHDDGTAVGSAHSAPPHIDSIAQSWAVLSGAGDPDRCQHALAAAERLLVREHDRLVLLLAPPFGAGGPDPGYIAAYPPGVRENGGQYTHAAAWLGWAHAARGDGDAAHRIARLLNPLERTGSPRDVDRYRVEPYVLAGDVYARPPWVGRGGWTWYTGAAAWTWRLVVEGLLGLRRRRGALEIDPCIPRGWDGFEAWVRAGERTVHVVVRNPEGVCRGIAEVRVDGRPADRARVDLAGKGERIVEIRLGAGRDLRP
jgi:cyclic beta-1,2-glucan synthetase